MFGKIFIDPHDSGVVSSLDRLKIGESDFAFRAFLKDQNIGNDFRSDFLKSCIGKPDRCQQCRSGGKVRPRGYGF